METQCAALGPAIKLGDDYRQSGAIYLILCIHHFMYMPMRLEIVPQLMHYGSNIKLAYSEQFRWFHPLIHAFTDGWWS